MKWYKNIVLCCYISLTEELIPSLQVAQNPITEGNSFSVEVQLNIPSLGLSNDITLTLSTVDGTAGIFVLYSNVILINN